MPGQDCAAPYAEASLQKRTAARLKLESSVRDPGTRGGQEGKKVSLTFFLTLFSSRGEHEH